MERNFFLYKCKNKTKSFSRIFPHPEIYSTNKMTHVCLYDFTISNTEAFFEDFTQKRHLKSTSKNSKNIDTSKIFWNKNPHTSGCTTTTKAKTNF